MITRIEALGYKSLRYVDRHLRPFQILVGPNASGKSTFLDVPSFLQDLLVHGVEAAVLARANSLRELTWKGQAENFELATELVIPREEESEKHLCRYEVRVGVGAQGGLILEWETFLIRTRDHRPGAREAEKPPTLFQQGTTAPDTIVIDPRKPKGFGWRKVINRTPGGNVYFRAETSGWNAPFRIDQQKSAFANLPEDEERFPVAVRARRLMLSGLHRLMLNSQKMREACRPDAPKTFKPDGSNLPLLVTQLRQHAPQNFQRWLAHVQQALPEIDDIAVREREVDRFLYLEVSFRGGLRLPTWMLSDGTLRFLALTLLAYLPNPGNIFLIEEPENGIHPKALELVFQSLSSIYQGQTLVATHSPLFLALAEPKDLFCFSLTPAGETVVVPGSEHAHLREWRSDINLGELFAAGVLT